MCILASYFSYSLTITASLFSLQAIFALKHLYINVFVFFRQENALFRESISLLENQPKVKGLSFTSFLILPFQRITRLKLLVQVSVSQLEVLNNLCGE